MLSFLKTTVDDASGDQRAKIVAIYVLLFTANIAIWTWAVIALADRPALIGTAFLAYVLGLRHAVDRRSRRGIAGIHPALLPR